jgi:hypothetical protein
MPFTIKDRTVSQVALVDLVAIIRQQPATNRTVIGLLI